jgi:HAD superfamily hydrolase (TIGR01509 family)
MFEAVIFDWDGTLADTRQVIVYSFQKALSEVHCKVSDEYIERRIGIGSAETFIEILLSAKVPFDDALIKRLVKKKIQSEVEMSEKVRLFDGSLDLLEALHGKVKLGLASMNNREVIDHMLKRLNVRRFFDAVLTADEISHPKPDPEVFLKSALKLEVSPDRCVVVEDSIFGVKRLKRRRWLASRFLQAFTPKPSLKRQIPT